MPREQSDLMSIRTISWVAGLGGLLVIGSTQACTHRGTAGTVVEHPPHTSSGAESRIRHARLSRPRLSSGTNTNRRQPPLSTTTLTGWVLDDTGNPVTGALIDPTAIEGDFLVQPGFTTTDRSGRFILPLEISRGGSFGGRLIARAVGQLGAADLNGGPAETLTTLIEIHLERTVAIHGQILSGSNVAAGATVRAELRGSIHERTTPVVSTLADQEGRFELEVPGSGLYSVTAFREGASDQINVQIVGGAVPPDVLVRLPETHETRVHVTNEHGDPVASVQVRYGVEAVAETDPLGSTVIHLSAGEAVQFEHASYQIEWATANNNRIEVTLTRLTRVMGQVRASVAGVTTIMARDDSRPDWMEVARLSSPGLFEAAIPLWLTGHNLEIKALVEGVGDSQSVSTTVRDGRDSDVGILIAETQIGSIAGVVRDSDGNPVCDAMVSAVRLGGAHSGGSTRTDATGHFRFAELVSGTHRLSAAWGDSAYATLETTVKSGEERNVEIVPDYEAEPETTEDDTYEGDDVEEPLGYTVGFQYDWATDEHMIALQAVAAPGIPGGILPGDRIAVPGYRTDAELADDGPLIGRRGAIRVVITRPATGETFQTTLERDQEWWGDGCGG